MAVVFIPNKDSLGKIGYESVGHVPVIFDSNQRYHREINRHLRERACLDWTPRGDSSASKRAKGRRINYPTPLTMLTYANALKNSLEWYEARHLDWKTVDYEHDLIRYRDDMVAGRWSESGRRLSNVTAESRVDRAIEFLNWAADCGLRSDLDVPKFTERKTFGSDTSSQDMGKEVTVRAGRKGGQSPEHLRLPSKDELAIWLRKVEERRGMTKALACRTALELALRKQELVSLRASILPRDKRRWNVVGDNVILHITEGTKGGRDRWVQCPIPLAVDLHQYITGRRLRSLSIWTKKHRGEAAPDALFLSESTGDPLSAGRFYNAWTCWRIFDGWCPHLGRSVWACYTLLGHLKLEADRVGTSLDKLPGIWIHGTGDSLIKLYIQPQLGHVDASTSVIYLRWIMNHLAVVSHYETWHSLLGGENG